VRDLTSTLDSVSSGPVRVDERARELAAQVMHPGVRVLSGPVMLPLNVITTGCCPGAAPSSTDWRWGRVQQRVYRLAVAALPRVIAVHAAPCSASGRCGRAWSSRPAAGNDLLLDV